MSVHTADARTSSQEFCQCKHWLMWPWWRPRRQRLNATALSDIEIVLKIVAIMDLDWHSSNKPKLMEETETEIIALTWSLQQLSHQSRVQMPHFTLASVFWQPRRGSKWPLLWLYCQVSRRESNHLFESDFGSGRIEKSGNTSKNECHRDFLPKRDPAYWSMCKTPDKGTKLQSELDTGNRHCWRKGFLTPCQSVSMMILQQYCS